MSHDPNSRGITVYLPWPDKRLSPNARVHWRTAWRVKTKARTLASLAVYDALRDYDEKSIGDGDCPLAVSITAIPKDNRRRDEDNLLGSLKAALDGIAGGLGVDDTRFRIQGPRILPARPDKASQIAITIQPEVEP